MKHLLRNAKTKTVRIGDGDVVIKQFDTHYILLIEQMRKNGASDADVAVTTIMHGVEGDFTEEDIRSLVPEDFKAVMTAVDDFNRQFLPQVDDEDLDDADEDDSGND